MEILFKTKRLQKLCVDRRERVKKLGLQRSKILQRRLDDLRAAEDLATGSVRICDVEDTHV